MTAPVQPPSHMARYSPRNTASEADGRLYSPNFADNYAPIRNALRPWLQGRTGTVLEIGSGTGHHVAHWARELPRLAWVPSDIDARHRAGIAAWGAALGCPNMVLPLALDAAADWATDPAVQALGSLDAVLCCNVIHIAPWAVAEGIVRGAAQSLAADPPLILYGAFRRGGRHLSERNASFDAALRADNPDWGVRDLDDVAELAVKAELGPARITAMPNNNLLVAFCRERR